MTVPQRRTFVTIGARDVSRLRAFYRGLGWTEEHGADHGYAAFVCGSVRLALHPLELLRAEAAPGAAVLSPGAWNGMALAVNVDGRAEVDRAYADALAAGATPIGAPVEQSWGGYSGYVADPEGTRWELAWAPGPDEA